MVRHKYNDIAVIYGSDSSEWEISCRSGEFVSSRIDGSLYNVYEIFARFGKWQLVAYRMKDSVKCSQFRKAVAVHSYRPLHSTSSLARVISGMSIS